MRILHCSDVHITQDYLAAPWRRIGWRRWLALAELSLGGRARKYAGARAALARIVEEATARGVDHVILSGDVTQYATEWEFLEARAALGPLADDPRRLTVIPGNHDRYTPRSLSSRRFERHFGHLLHSDLPEHRREEAYPFVRLLGDEAAVVGLLSARVPPVPGIAAGRVGTAQLEGLRALLADPRMGGRAVLVVVHHAPWTHRGRPDGYFHGLQDAPALLSLIRGPRFAVLHGHIHHRYHHPSSEVRPHAFGAGSSTEKGHEGYWVIEVRDGQVVGGTKHGLGEASLSHPVTAGFGGSADVSPAAGAR